MNQGCHRIIFSRARGQMMAVAETAPGRRKTPGEGRRRARRLATAATLAGLGLPVADAAAQIVAYRDAPGSQRPTVLDAGNGVPLVNIQTPSAAGVSRNTYSQFDVQQNGAILNNSRKGAQTHLAGQVAGNPWLARGTARVILNEVVAGSPSQLRGIIEVGGDRAEVVIANPAGIDVDGAGFINASRATLTTGTATVSNGSLQGYEVRQGTITVQGGGLDASQTDYTAVLARAVRINGAVHAKDLKIVTGANRVSADHQQVTPIEGTGPAPAFALDVSALGGMYAGKITLIGTEAGIGVRNAGTIAASTGEVVITADGRLENTGQIISHADAEVSATGGIGNRGTVYAGGTLRLVTRRNIDNTGLIGAQSNVALAATGGDSDIRSLAGSILIAGLRPDGTLADLGSLTLSAGRHIQASGTNRAAERVEATSPSISFEGSNTLARIVRLDALPSPRRRRYGSGNAPGGGGIDVSGATIAADDVSVATDGLLRTDRAQVVAGHLDIQAHGLSNQDGSLHQTGGGALNLDFAGDVDNTRGSIQSTGTLTVRLDGALANGSGLIAGAVGTDVEAGSASNSGVIAGNLHSRGDLDNAGVITGSASAGDHLNNAGQIAGPAIAGGAIDNPGTIGGTAAAGTRLDNRGLIAGDAIAIDITNGGGILGSAQAGGSLTNGGTIVGSAVARGRLDNAGLIGLYAVAEGDLQNTGLIAGPALAGNDLGNSGYVGGHAVAGASLRNAGQIAGPAIAGGAIDNSGTIGGTAAAGTRLDNRGLIAGDAIAVDITNGGGILGSAQAGGSLTNGGTIVGSAVARGRLDNAGLIGLYAVAEGDLQNTGLIAGPALAGNDLSNSGYVGGHAVAGASLRNAGMITGSTSAGGHLDNTGLIAGQATAGGDLANGGTIVGGAIARGRLDNMGLISLYAATAGDLHNAGMITGPALAGNDLDNSGFIAGPTSAGGTIDNSGTIGGTAAAGARLDNRGLIAGDAIAIDIANGGGILGSAQASGHLDNTGLIGLSAATAGDLHNTGMIAGPALAGNDLDSSGFIGGHAVAGANLRNAGLITGSASAGGHLDNAGLIAGLAIAGGAIDNSGTIADAALAGTHLHNHGLIGADAIAGANLNNSGDIDGHADAAGSIHNAGHIGGTAVAGADIGNSGHIAGSASAGSSLDNTGTIAGSAGAGGALHNAGSIGGSAVATQAITNSGRIGGSAAADGTIDNSGSIGSSGSSVSVIAGQINNSGQIGTSGAQVTISTDGFSNDHGQVSGQRVSISAARISNAAGRIHAGESLLVATQGDLDNTAGVIEADGLATVVDSGDPARRTLRIINTDGSLRAGRALVIEADSLGFDGEVASRGDISLALGGDYTHRNGQDFFQADGAVSLSFTGTVTNADPWYVAAGLRVSGGQVVNTGEISSDGLTLVEASQGSLQNRGLIAGRQVVTLGQGLDNQGGSIIGESYLGVFRGSVENSGGQFDISGSASLRAGGNLINIGGRIDTGSLSLSVGGDLINETLPLAGADRRVHEWSIAGLTMGTTASDSTGLRAGITARQGDLSLFVGGNLHMTAADLVASGDLQGLVLGDIEVGGLNLHSETRTLTTSGIGGFGDGGEAPGPITSHQERGSRFAASSLSAGGDLSLVAGGSAHYQGLDITAGGHLTLGAVTGDLHLTAATDSLEIRESTTGNGTAAASTVDTLITTGVGGRLAASGDLRLLAGHNLELTGASASAGGQLIVAAGHDIEVTNLATGTQSTRVITTPVTGDEFSPPTSQEQTISHQSVTYQGGDFTAGADIVFAAGHGNPFGTTFLADMRQSRLDTGHDADAVAPAVPADDPGSLSLYGVDLVSGSTGSLYDITLLAAGNVDLGGSRDGVTDTATPAASLLPGWAYLSQEADPVSTVTPGDSHGHYEGATIRIRADQGNVSLAGLTLMASGDLLAHGAGNLRMDGSQLSADGDISLSGLAGVSAQGFSLEGRDVLVSSLGHITLAGSSLHEEWSGPSDQHLRDTALASTIDGHSLTLQALGERGDINLAHLAVTTTGATRILATGQVNIDPGADYSYDYWTESRSSGFLVEKTTTSEHVRESLTIRPSTFSVGSFELQALGDATLTATRIDSAGAVSLFSGGDIRYLAAHDQNYVLDESHSSRSLFGLTFQRTMDRHTEADQRPVVTSLQTTEDVFSHSDGSTTLEGTRIQAGGAVTVLANADLEVLPATGSLFLEDVHEQWSLVSPDHKGIEYRMRDLSSTSAITLSGADILGNVVTLAAGGNAHLVAASVSGTQGAEILAGGVVLVEAGLETHVSTHEHHESQFGAYQNFVGGRYHGTSVGTLHRSAEDTGTGLTPVGNQIGSALGSLTIAGAQGTLVLGSRLTAQGNILLGQGGPVLVAGSLAQEGASSHAETSTTALKVRDGFEDQWQLATVVPSFLQAGGRVVFSAAESHVSLGAVNILSGGATEFQTPEIHFLGERGSRFSSHEAWDKDRGYEMMEGSGHVNETLTLAHIDAQGGVLLPAGTGVSVQLDAGGQTLSASQLQSLARQTGQLPGMAWLKDLADRPDVDWQAIQTAHQNWDYSHQGLTREGALALTIVVSCIAGPAIGEALSTAAQGAAAATITEGLVAGTITTTGQAVAIQAGYAAVASAGTAGLTSLATSAAISFANNGGNLSATLHDLGSSSTVRGILSSMISGGVGGYFGNGWSAGRLVAQTLAGCAGSGIVGGKCETGAAWALGTGAAAWLWTYTRDVTDRLKLTECTPTNTCVYDNRGELRTDGARTVDWTNNPQHEGNWLTESGMNGEGKPHIYDNITWLRNFVVNVSKMHDWFNSWSYNWQTGQYASQGVLGDSLFQLYSFAGMPIAGAVTGLSYLGQYPELLYLVPPNRDEDKP